MPQTLTLDELSKIAQEFKQSFPFAGMEIVESPFVPDGMMLLKGAGKIAIVKEDEGKITLIEDPIFRSF